MSPATRRRPAIGRPALQRGRLEAAPRRWRPPWTAPSPRRVETAPFDVPDVFWPVCGYVALSAIVTLLLRVIY